MEKSKREGMREEWRGEGERERERKKAVLRGLHKKNSSPKSLTVESGGTDYHKFL